MKVHHLKIESGFFMAVADERKTFEVRKDDRGFDTGDLVVLWEINNGMRTGRKVFCEITYILRGQLWCKDGYCIMAVKLIKAFL